MAQNVSSVRVAIQGDARGLNAELIKASKAVTDFGGKTNRSSVKGLDSQLSQVRRQLNEVAEQYVTGGKIQRSEIEKLVDLEKRLTRQIQARNAAISAARKDFTPLPEVAAAASSSPLIALNSVDRQMAAIQRKGPNVNFIVSQLGFAAEDAAVSFGTAGLAGALRGASNNLSVVAMAFNPVAGIIVGVGTALAASLIPMLGKTTKELDEGKRAAEEMANALRDLRDAQRQFQVDFDINRLIDMPEFAREVAGLNSQQRFDTLRGLRNEEQRNKIRRDEIIGRVELSLRGSGLGQMTAGYIAQLPFNDIQKAVRDYDKLNRTTTNLDLKTLLDLQLQLIDIDRELDGIRQRGIVLRDTPALQDLTESEKALESLRGMGADIGNLFGRAGNIARERRAAFAESDPLQAGYQFGSIEAVSAINRATFNRPDPVDKDIEKNTRNTANSVKDVAKEIRKIAPAMANVIGKSFSIGAPL